MWAHDNYHIQVEEDMIHVVCIAEKITITNFASCQDAVDEVNIGRAREDRVVEEMYVQWAARVDGTQGEAHGESMLKCRCTHTDGCSRHKHGRKQHVDNNNP